MQIPRGRKIRDREMFQLKAFRIISKEQHTPRGARMGIDPAADHVTEPLYEIWHDYRRLS